MITSPPHWRQEAPKLLKLATPILVGQLAQIGLGVTDTIMAGRYSAQDLAAIAIGQSIWLPIFMFFLGLSTACTTLVAHHTGANNQSGIKHTVQQTMWLLTGLLPLGIFAVLQGDLAFSAMGIDASVSNISGHYLAYLAMGFPAIACYLALRSFSEGMGATRPIMLVNLLGLLVNIPLNYIFIYGKAGMPAMGAVGCGLASAIVMWVQLLAVLLVVTRLPLLKSIRVFSQWQAPQWPLIRSLLNLGLPVALSVMAEVALFSAVALILAHLGANVVAGHQIALSISGITFMMPLSLGIAMTIQSGQYLGAKQTDAARYVCRMGVLGGILIALLSMTLLITAREYISGIYTNDPEIQRIAMSLLLFAGVFQIPDAIQVCASSALRGFLDTRVPMLIMLFAYWMVSLPLGWSLTHGIGDIEAIGAKGMWVGLVCGLSVAAALQGWRLHWKLSR